MAVNVRSRGEKFELRVKHKLLPKAFYATFTTQAEASAYGAQMDAMLDGGHIPAELAHGTDGRDVFLSTVIENYRRIAPITDSDDNLLAVVLKETDSLKVSGVTFRWSEAYIRQLKLDKNLSPGSIRKRMGVLARILDWHIARSDKQGLTAPINPLRLLPVGYSQYSRTDALGLEAGKEVKVDVKRDYRVPIAEQEKIEQTLQGVKRNDRERPLPVDVGLQMLFRLIIDTGLRMSRE